MAEIYGLREIGTTQYFYVGSTKYTGRERLEAHLSEVRLGTHANKHLANKVRKLGVDRVELDTLEVVEENDRFVVEKRWIEQLLNNGHRLVNRIHNGVSFEMFDALHETQERVLTADDVAYVKALLVSNERAITSNPSMQWLLDAITDELRECAKLLFGKYRSELIADFGSAVVNGTNE